MQHDITKISENKSLTSVTGTAESKTALHLQDNRPQSVLQKRQAEALANVNAEIPIQQKANNTGLPDKLKSGIEALSGHSMDDVKVHYNSAQPAQLNAHAYAQGTDIHLAPGQEKHLPHEAWHVVQQKQGRVKPTMQMKGKVNINDEKGLEKEADVLGGRAFSVGGTKTIEKTIHNKKEITHFSIGTQLVVQRAVWTGNGMSSKYWDPSTKKFTERPKKPASVQISHPDFVSSSEPHNQAGTSHHNVDWAELKDSLASAVTTNNFTIISNHAQAQNVSIPASLTALTLQHLALTAHPLTQTLLTDWNNFAAEICWAERNLFAGPRADIRGSDPSGLPHGDQFDFHTTASGTVTPRSETWQEMRGKGHATVGSMPALDMAALMSKLSVLATKQSTLDRAEWFKKGAKFYQKGDPRAWRSIESAPGVIAGHHIAYTASKTQERDLHKEIYGTESVFRHSAPDKDKNPEVEFPVWKAEYDSEIVRLNGVKAAVMADITHLKTDITDACVKFGHAAPGFPDSKLSLTQQETDLKVLWEPLHKEQKAHDDFSAEAKNYKVVFTNGSNEELGGSYDYEVRYLHSGKKYTVAKGQINSSGIIMATPQSEARFSRFLPLEWIKVDPHSRSIMQGNYGIDFVKV